MMGFSIYDSGLTAVYAAENHAEGQLIELASRP